MAQSSSEFRITLAVNNAGARMKTELVLAAVPWRKLSGVVRPDCQATLLLPCVNARNTPGTKTVTGIDEFDMIFV
jgi:hypothetical protein